MLNVQTVAVATVSLVPVYVPLVTLVLHANAVFARMTAMVTASAKPKSNWLMIIPTTPTMPLSLVSSLFQTRPKIALTVLVPLTQEQRTMAHGIPNVL